MRLLAQHKRLECSFRGFTSDQPLLIEGEPEPPPPRGRGERGHGFCNACFVLLAVMVSVRSRNSQAQLLALACLLFRSQREGTALAVSHFPEPSERGVSFCNICRHLEGATQALPLFSAQVCHPLRITKHLGFLLPSASELIRDGAPASRSHLHGSFKILYFML